MSQRYGYQESPSKEGPAKRPVKLPARYKNAKMTVRLRPRQVLCSKCRGICNENSENVDNSRKRKVEEDNNVKNPTKRVSTYGMQTRASKPLISDSQSNEQQQKTISISLRLPNTTLSKKIQNGHDEVDEENSSDSNRNNEYPEVSQNAEVLGARTRSNKSMVLRKKHSVGSMEDLWDESVFEENNLGELGQNTRTIKISFGREGEGTILKIPAKIDDLVGESNEKDKKDSAKAARRALKKAKKEARRKIMLGSGGSPCYPLGGNSPRYSTLGGNSPRCTVGAGSPRYTLTSSTAGYENLVPRRHKHKV